MRKSMRLGLASCVIAPNLRGMSSPPGATSESASSPQTSTAPSAALVPTLGRQRIASLDVLRGVALLGILPVNIVSFGGVMAAMFDPALIRNLSPAENLVDAAVDLLFTYKFITIFSALFGAGIVLMAEHAAAAGKTLGQTAGVYYRRLAVLFGFGFIHAYGVWYGDILLVYALTGAAAFWLHRLAPRWLLLIGFGLIAFGWFIVSGLGWIGVLAIQFKPSLAEEMSYITTPDFIAWEYEAYTGGYLDQLPARALVAGYVHTVIFALQLFWRTAGVMALGMAFYKMRVLTAERSTGFYLGMIGLGVLVGLPIAAVEVATARSDLGVYTIKAIQGTLAEWSSLLIAGAWIGMVMLLCRSGMRLWLHPFAAVGRAALSNYLLQSLICTTLFYGHGFGLFGQLSRVQQLGVVLAIWVLQLVISPLWLALFRFGPAEWLWRSLTYWKPQPMRR